MNLKLNLSGKTNYDISSLLQLANFTIIVIAPVMFLNEGPTMFINGFTVALACIFCILNILILYYEIRNRDPFMQILVFVTTLFYLTRILTLMYDPIPHYTSALQRFKIQVYDFNYALIFIILSNVFIFLGLAFAKGKIIFKEIDFNIHKPGNPLTVSFILLFTLVSNYFFILGFESLGRLSSFIASIFMGTGMILLMTINYTLMNYRNLSKVSRIVLILLFTLFLVIATIHGSRSSFLTLFILFICVVLSLKNKILISRRSIFIGILLIPILIFSFLVATYVRKLQYDTKTVIDKERIEYIKEFKLADLAVEQVQVLSPIFDRVGYLGYSVDMITNAKKYRRFINFRHYFKSIIDNGLTPGFDVFDTPRASHSLKYVYFNIKEKPTQKAIAANYNSDMFTIYGEYYILFGGYPALILLLLAAYLFKKIYLIIKTDNIFLFYLLRSLILLIYYNWLISFGFDWMIVEIIGYLIPIFIWWKSFSMKMRKIS